MEVAIKNGFKPRKVTVCGGGAKSRAWLKILAGILNLPLTILATEQGPAYGAAALAMVGCGQYESVDKAAEKLIKVRETVLPDGRAAERYAKKYEKFKKLYPALKGVLCKP